MGIAGAPWPACACVVPIIGALLMDCGICACVFIIGRLSVPVRSACVVWMTVSGAWARRDCDRPVAITVTRSWSPRLSS